MKIKIQDFWEREGRNSRPVPDKKSIDFLNKAVSPKYLYDEDVAPKFIKKYYSWIQQSKLNNLCGLDKFDK